MGLDRPTSGSVRVNGKAPAAHAAPLHEVGALLEARAVHPGRVGAQPPAGAGSHQRHRPVSGRPGPRLVGLTEVADKRVGGFSLGMGQRLGVAAALLGDPATADARRARQRARPRRHPLDPRRCSRGWPAEGRTVFLSSHLMSEMAVTADHVIVVGKGRLLRDQPMADFIDEASVETVRVRASGIGPLAPAASRTPARTVTPGRRGAHRRRARPATQIGTLAAQARITVLELSPQSASLEDAYLALTRDSVDYRADDHDGQPVHALASDEGAA